MADKGSSTAKTPVAPTKGKVVERVERGMRSNSTGGDAYDRSRNRYSKNSPDQKPDYDYE